MRLVDLAVLIDLSGLQGLDGITQREDRIVVGALTRHTDIGNSALIVRYLPLLTQALPHIAHPAVRNRGTFGGSIAHADPAAEWPACCVALDADIVVAGRAGERRIRAREFFRGVYDTALGAGEIIVAVEFPLPRARTRVAFRELARRHGDFAIAGIAARAEVSDGILRSVDLAVFGADTRPVLAGHAAAALAGQPVTPACIAAAQQALAHDIRPTDDVQHSAALRMQLVRTLLARVVADLLHDPGSAS